MIVVDNSIFIAALFDDERAHAPTVLWNEILDGRYVALVPSLFYSEAYNAVLMALRRKRITPAVAQRYYKAIEQFPLRVVEVGDRKDAALIAHRHSLTFYDALYLALAIEHKSVLASLDMNLVKAAKKEKIAVFTA